MGITISHRLKLNKIYIKDALDKAQELANTLKKEQAEKMEISFTIRRESDYWLMVDIGGCETLSLNFRSAFQLVVEKEKGWSYEWETLTDGGKKELDNGYDIQRYPQNEIYFASGFCKTQYASSVLEHYWVAEILRSVASRCVEAIINDEGDYYHSGKLEDATKSIESLGKMINNLGAVLGAKFGDKDNVEIIAGGRTTIKSNKKDKK